MSAPLDPPPPPHSTPIANKRQQPISAPTAPANVLGLWGKGRVSPHVSPMPKMLKFGGKGCFIPLGTPWPGVMEPYGLLSTKGISWP